MRYHNILAALALASFAVACEPREEASDEGPADTTVAEMADTMANRVSTEPVKIELDEVNNSGIEGEATATHSQNDATVSILLKDGAKPETSYTAHIHTGTCEKGGPVAVDLGTIQNLQGSKTIPTSQLPMNQDHFVQVHDAAGKPVACGDMKGHDMDNMHRDSAAGTTTTH